MNATSLTLLPFPSTSDLRSLLQLNRTIPFSHNSISRPRCLNSFITKPAFLKLSVSSTNIRAENVENGSTEIDMVRSNDGTYSPEQKNVMVLWDLDNKPPRLPPYDASLALRNLAQIFGDVMDISAYWNRSTAVDFSELVIDEDGERWKREILEKEGLVTPSGPFFCKLCGKRSRTLSDLEGHFRDKHEKEHKKRLDRINMLKGKRRQRYEERYSPKARRFEKAGKDMFEPKEGDVFVSELRRAGVLVRGVQDKKEAVYKVLKRQLPPSSSRAVDWLVLVSDDLDFTEMLVGAKKWKVGAVVVGENQNSLSQYANYWVQWDLVENGNFTEDDLRPVMNNRYDGSNIDVDDYDSVNVTGQYVDARHSDNIVDEVVHCDDEVNGSDISQEEKL